MLAANAYLVKNVVKSHACLRDVLHETTIKRPKSLQSILGNVKIEPFLKIKANDLRIGLGARIQISYYQCIALYLSGCHGQYFTCRKLKL